MKRSELYILILILLAGWLWVPMAAGRSSGGLKIYLPGTAKVKESPITLGSVGIILGDNTLAEKAGQVTLGTFVTSGQRIIVDRQTVLSRMASAGINTAGVTFCGVQRVTVEQEQACVEGETFVEIARSFLMNELADVKVASVRPVKKPGAWVLPDDAGDVQYVSMLGQSASPGIKKVVLLAVRDGVEIGRTEVMFAVRYNCRKVVAKSVIHKGTLITAQMIEVQMFESNQPEPAGWTLPVGMVAGQTIHKGMAVLSRMVKGQQAPVIITRRQQVIVRLDTGLLHVSAQGEAMDEGGIGDEIRVKRGQRPNERIVLGTIMADGTVIPKL